MSKDSGFFPQQERRGLTSFAVAEHSDLFSSTSHLGPLHNPPRIMEMDPSRSRPPQLSTQDVLADIRLLPGVGDAPVRGIPKPWNIMKFYDAGANDSPWVPPGIIPEGHAGQGRDLDGPAAIRDPFATPYREWRDPAPSECDTMPPGHLPSDSGYESRRTKQSIANASVYGDVDRGHETQSLTSRMDDFFPYVGLPSDSSCSGDPASNISYLAHSAGLPTLHGQSDSAGTKHVCPGCQRSVKTKSELKKHEQRHTKPHKCDVPDCPRHDLGFSTSNDLDRHKRSVHADVGIAGRRFRCHLMPCQPKDKIWPRADNFRSHLKRVHQISITEDDLNQYIVPASEILPQPQPNQGSREEGAGGAVSTMNSLGYTSYNQTMPASMWANHQSQDLEMPQLTASGDGPQTELDIPDASPASPDLPRLEASDMRRMDREISLDLAPDGIHRQEQSNCPGSPRSTVTKNPELPAPKTESGLSAGKEFHLKGLGISGSLDGTLAERLNGADDLVDDDDLSQTSGASNAPSEGSPVEKKVAFSPSPRSIQLDGVRDSSSLPSHKGPMSEELFLDFLDSVPKDFLEDYLKKKRILPQAESAQNSPTAQELLPHKCTRCQKKFQRKCELRKHMKRHDKPYSCTFPECDRSFGSKNDWKRHENSQHIHHEIWKCKEPDVDGSDDTCGKVFPRREQFKTHLQSAHTIQDSGRLDQELSDCRVGQTCDSRFWCGFCVKIIEADKVVHAWTERFNHIDDHFYGRNSLPKMVISDWKQMGPGLPDTAFASCSDGSEASESVLSYQEPGEMSPSGATSHSEVDSTPAGKRKMGEDGDYAESARPRKESTLMWNCCNCLMQSSFRFSGECVATDGCTHQRCDNCTLSSPEDIDGTARKESMT